MPRETESALPEKVSRISSEGQSTAFELKSDHNHGQIEINSIIFNIFWPVFYHRFVYETTL
jgi:hypothetical protein